MHRGLSQRQERSLLDDWQTVRKLEFNQRRNLELDHSRLIDEAAARFRYEECRGSYWNPPEFSLLWGTKLWDGATEAQRVVLNQLYWVAYYAQIVSAEIATIYYNQIAAAGMYGLEDFRLVCDTLDLESKQERAHIAAFKKVGEETEFALFGERLFTYPMRSPFAHTMVFADTGAVRNAWRRLQLSAYALLSSSNAVLGSRYLMIRGLRTLNGKLVQHRLSRFYSEHPDKESAPIPSAISYYHFVDESFHFNTSRIVAHDIPRSLPEPTAFERWVINRGVAGCQRDHYAVSAAVNGIFWHEPALVPVLYRLLRSPVFAMADREARAMLAACLTEPSEGVEAAFATHRTARESYRKFLEKVDHLTPANRELRLMGRSDEAGYFARNRRALARFAPA
jgi:hypothetical protein